MTLIPLNVAVNNWLALLGKLEAAPVALGFLASLFSMIVAFEMRIGVNPSAPKFKQLTSQMGYSLFYVLGAFFSASFTSLALHGQPINAYSLQVVLPLFFLMLALVGLMVTVVTRIKTTWLYRICFSVCTTTTFLLADCFFGVFPQYENIELIQWPTLFYIAPLIALLMYSQSCIAQNARDSVQVPVTHRMFHVISVTLVNLFSATAVLSTVMHVPGGSTVIQHNMHLTHESYEKLLIALCFVLITLFTVSIYKKVLGRMQGLEGEAEKLARENSLKEELVANQRDLLFKTTARVKELEYSLQQEQFSEGICADSLITAVLNLEDGIFEWDLDKHTLKLGPIWCELLGISPEMDSNTLHTTLLARVVPEDWAGARLKISNLLTGSAIREQAQLRYASPAGCTLKLDVKVVAVRNPYGLPNRLVGTLTDRTRDMDVEYAIRMELIEESTLSRLKSDFVSYLSHEIRTPMTIISSANALLDSDVRTNRLNPDRVLDYSEQVSNALNSLRSLVDETLDFMTTSNNAQLMEFDVRPVNIASLVHSVVELESKRRQMSSTHAIKVEIQEPLPDLAEVCETLLTQAIRQFVVYLMQEWPGTVLWVQTDGGYKIKLGACLPRQPDWLVYPECRDAPQLVVRDEALPFGLLLTKRVIRNIKGGLNVLVQKGEPDIGFCLVMEFPYAKAFEYQA